MENKFYKLMAKLLNFINANVKVGDKIKVDYKITPNYDFKFMVGGHALLVNNGQAVKYTKDINVLGGRRARTAAGISADGKKIYLAPLREELLVLLDLLLVSCQIL